MQVENLLSEVRYAEYTATGKVTESVTFVDFVRLFVNHRPVLGVGKAQLHDALRLIGAAVGAEGGSVNWKLLQGLLQTRGEVCVAAAAAAGSGVAACVRACVRVAGGDW